MTRKATRIGWIIDKKTILTQILAPVTVGETL